MSTATSTCPVCDSITGAPFVAIADAPVHCNLLWDSASGARQAPRGDIDLTFCDRCGHIFNSSFDEARTTYGAAYENSLHHSGVFQEYATRLVADLVERHDLRGRDIVEVGAGQGDFLQMLCAAGGNRGAGFDPSYVGASSPDSDITLVAAFYDEQFADHPADLIVCRHVLEHIGASGQFVGMIRRVIGTRPTVAFFEVPNALWTVREGGIWDAIYEHCGYFTPTSLEYVFRTNGFDVDRLASVFGGQFLAIEARPAADDAPAPTDKVAVEEVAADVARFAAVYAEAVERWTARFAGMAARQQSAVIWGAGSKGVMFLNSVDTHGVIDRAVDINPRKHGMHVAGSGQRIVGPMALQDAPPDVVLVMNPNYEREVQGMLHDLGLGSTVLTA